jgi:hypothetical protein
MTSPGWDSPMTEVTEVQLRCTERAGRVSGFNDFVGPDESAVIDMRTVGEPVPAWAAPVSEAWTKWRRRCEWLADETAIK